MDADPFDLQRFVQAQDGVYADVLAELRSGRKASHWMWFVFPQRAGLGHSAMARRYALRSREEAQAYLRHPLLGARLLECTVLVNAVPARGITQIFGTPDDLKFHSCMSLFAAVAPQAPAFGEALLKYFGGRPDPQADFAITS